MIIKPSSQVLCKKSLLDYKILSSSFFSYSHGATLVHFGDPQNRLTLKFVSAVKQRYTLRLVPRHPVEPQVLLTMRPRYGLPLTVILNGAKDLQASEG
jgi:hypothetical protein